MADVARIPVLIAEDEGASRARLRQLLARHSDVSLVAECATGPEAAAAIVTIRPAAVFLDIQMPGFDGFEVLGRTRQAPPAIVFVTAYDHYAVRAFDVRAVDYLLKPYDDERFDRALEAVRRELRARRQTETAGPATIVAGVEARLAVRDGSTLVFLEIAAISHITAEGCYSRIHLRTRSLLVREPLGRLGARLTSPGFCQVHRSAIVNVSAIVQVGPRSHGDLQLTLATGQTLRVSRRYRGALDALMAGDPLTSPVGASARSGDR